MFFLWGKTAEVTTPLGTLWMDAAIDPNRYLFSRATAVFLNANANANGCSRTRVRAKRKCFLFIDTHSNITASLTFDIPDAHHDAKNLRRLRTD